MRLDHFNLIFKVNRAVAFNVELLGIRMAEYAAAAHINELRKEFIYARVDHGERVDWDQYFVALAVDSHRVIIVFVLIRCWSELDIDFLSDAGRDHALLLVLSDLEVARLRRQDVQPLRCRRVVDHSEFHSVRLVRLKASELDNAGRNREYSIRPDRVIHMLLSEAHSFLCLDLAD